MSDSIVVPQSPTSSGVIVTDGHRGGHHHRGLEGKDASFFVLNSMSDLSRDLSSSRAEGVTARFEGQLKSVEIEARLQARIDDNKYHLAVDKADRKQDMAALRCEMSERFSKIEMLMKDQEIQRLRDALNSCQNPTLR